MYNIFFFNLIFEITAGVNSSPIIIGSPNSKDTYPASLLLKNSWDGWIDVFIKFSLVVAFV